jgi:hypothetical protein
VRNYLRAAFLPFLAVLIAVFAIGLLAQPQANEVVVKISTQQTIRTFDPSRALGGGIDGHDKGTLDRQLTPANIAQMLEAGLGPVTYRLRTELGGEAWHWNSIGTWSDAADQQGYWTSSTDAPPGGISLCYGYRLPRRGNTVDQANNDSYSRIDDGDVYSFWKSNPYLDREFTNESNLLHPQWVIIDLEKVVPVNAIKIAWGDQYAKIYDVEYSTERLTSDFGLRPVNGWKEFPLGRISQAHPGSRAHILAPKPVNARFIRVLLKDPAYAGPTTNDVRDRLGFAIREIYIGTVRQGGSLSDAVEHGKSNQDQSNVFVSSTDPWHRASEMDRNEEHIGFDRLVATGLTRGQPIMVPVAVLYAGQRRGGDQLPDPQGDQIRPCRTR